jgi:hypothetical protein
MLTKRAGTFRDTLRSGHGALKTALKIILFRESVSVQLCLGASNGFRVNSFKRVLMLSKANV